MEAVNLPLEELKKTPELSMNWECEAVNGGSMV
jgi:hypothetical protein